jgi:hypothetical protein
MARHGSDGRHDGRNLELNKRINIQCQSAPQNGKPTVQAEACRECRAVGRFGAARALDPVSQASLDHIRSAGPTGVRNETGGKVEMGG